MNRTKLSILFLCVLVIAVAFLVLLLLQSTSYWNVARGMVDIDPRVSQSKFVGYLTCTITLVLLAVISGIMLIHERKRVLHSKRTPFLLFVTNGAVVAFIIAFVMIHRDPVAGDRARATKKLMALMAGLETMKHDVGTYPSTSDGLGVLLVTSNSGKGPYVDLQEYPDLLDPWGRRIQYRHPGRFNSNGYDLWSYGKDGKDDSDEKECDDVRNWK